jgi:myo-inositol-1(or 4)-monophosphatase
MRELVSRVDLAKSLAIDAGEKLVQMAASAKITPSFKPDRSIVTEADIASDKFIHASIQNRFPDDLIISEELHPSKPLYSGIQDSFLWIIDPLDGTTNFSLGLPFWGVSIACLKNGELFIGAINFPLLDELYSAQKGQGAFLNDELLPPDQPASKLQLSFFSSCSRAHKQYKVSVPYKTRILGSACFTFCSVAKGSSILGFEATPKIWDIAAGWLIVQEAGKAVSTLNGSSPFPVLENLDYSSMDFPSIAAANQDILARGRQQITPLAK